MPKAKKKPKSLTDNDSLNAFRSACIQVARAYGISKDAEDAASWAIIKRLEGSKAAPKFLIIDYIRHTIGRNKEKTKIIRDALRKAVPIKDDYESDDEQISPGVVIASEDRGIKPNALYYVASILNLSLYERACFFLYYSEGLSEEYISCYLGTNPGHVKSTIGIINALISEKIKQEFKSYFE